MKIDQKEIGARIKAILDKKGMTQRALVKLLGVTDPTVSNYVRGESGVPAEVYLLISRLGGVSIEWLITGKELAGYVAESQEEYTVTIPVHAMGGAGDPCDLDQMEPIGEITIAAEYNGPSIAALLIRGTSMEPNIMNGAHVGIDRADREIISGQLYAIYIPHEGLVVKRIYIGPELVKIKSDNPTFPDHDMSIDRINWDTFVQGRVSWVIQRYVKS